ncbi:MAG: CcmD family protein [Bdellovibrionales bacterium]|nr:CcmD family protein [Bdellovibrionales bacterium]
MTEVPNSFPGLFWAYLVVWALITVYILHLGRKVSKLESKMDAIKSESSNNSPS